MTRGEVKALPVGAAGSIRTLAIVSMSLGLILLLSGTRLGAAGFRPARAIGINELAFGFVVIGAGLLYAYYTGRAVIFWLRAHSLYWGFWACLFFFAGWLFGSAFTAVPVYIGLSAWSMHVVATLKQWRRLKGRRDDR